MIFICLIIHLQKISKLYLYYRNASLNHQENETYALCKN